MVCVNLSPRSVHRPRNSQSVTRNVPCLSPFRPRGGCQKVPTAGGWLQKPRQSARTPDGNGRRSAREALSSTRASGPLPLVAQRKNSPKTRQSRIARRLQRAVDAVPSRAGRVEARREGRDVIDRMRDCSPRRVARRSTHVAVKALVRPRAPERELGVAASLRARQRNPVPARSHARRNSRWTGGTPGAAVAQKQQASRSWPSRSAVASLGRRMQLNAPREDGSPTRVDLRAAAAMQRPTRLHC